MLEVKFRAWDLVTEKLYRVNEIDFKNEHIQLQDDDGTITVMLDTVILIQYTGLKDHLDNYIYENDVVIGINRNNEEEIKQTITFLNGCFMFGNWNAHEYFNRHQKIKILGNIYDNPELIK